MPENTEHVPGRAFQVDGHTYVFTEAVTFRTTQNTGSCVDIQTGETFHVTDLIDVDKPFADQTQPVELFWRRPGGNLP